MTIETIIMLIAYGLVFLVLPLGTLIVKKSIPPKLMGIYGLLASAVVMAHILFRVFFVTAHVSKPRYHDDVIKVNVKPPIEAEFLQKVASHWVPVCDYEFIQVEAEFSTGCTPVNPQALDGEFTAVVGPRDEDPFVRYWVDEVEGMYYDGEEEVPMGKMSKGCVVAPWPLSLPWADEAKAPGVDSEIGMIWGHELAHLCGYAHSVGDPTSPDVRYHLMSRGVSYQGSDVEGLDFGNSEMYVPTIE